jgi:hypothetical protein
MTTYPTNVKVLDKDITNEVMEEAIVSRQDLYNLYIEPNTLETNSKLRIKATLSRVVGTPLPDSDVTCITCSEGGRAVPQELVQDRILSPRNSLSGYGSFSYVGEANGKHEIYEGIYSFDFTTAATFDIDRNWRLYRIRNNDFKVVNKVLTTTFDNLGIADAQPIHGISDEPAYGFSAIVSISSNAPQNFYLYYVTDKLQIGFDGYGQFYGSTFTIEDRKVFLIETNTGYIRGFRSATSAILFASNTTLSGIYGTPTAFHALGGFLYVLTDNNIIVKLLQDDLTVVTSWSLSPIATARALFAVNKSLIYFSFGALGVLGIAALNTGTGEFTIIDSSIVLTESIGFGTRSTLIFKAIDGQDSGYFYTTGSATFGTGGGSRIMRIGPVSCP